MLTSFLLLAFLINWSVWVLYGAFAGVGGILTDVCVAVDEVVAGLPSRLPEMDCSGVAMASSDATYQIQSGVVEAIELANADIEGMAYPCKWRLKYHRLMSIRSSERNSEGDTGVCAEANNEGVNVTSMLNDTCVKFNTGNELHSALCVSSASSADSALLSSVYNCVTGVPPDTDPYNVNGATRLAHVASSFCTLKKVEHGSECSPDA